MFIFKLLVLYANGFPKKVQYGKFTILNQSKLKEFGTKSGHLLRNVKNLKYDLRGIHAGAD